MNAIPNNFTLNILVVKTLIVFLIVPIQMKLVFQEEALMKLLFLFAIVHAEKPKELLQSP